MGFQGQLEDDEIKGEGNSLNYEYRMHDPRLGRFFKIDPLARLFPWNSPYAFSENRVVDGVELEGLEFAPTTSTSKYCSDHCGNPMAHSRGLTTHDCHKQMDIGKATQEMIMFTGVLTGLGFIAEAGMAALGSYLLEELIEEVAGFPIFPDPGDGVQYYLKKTTKKTVAPNPLKVLPTDEMAEKMAKRKALASKKMGGESKTRYVDFNKQVYTKSIEPGTELVQYRIKTAEGYGDYYAPKGTTPEEIGLASEDVVKTYKVTVNKSTEGTYSTHVEGKKLYYDETRTAKGGGTQIYSPDLKNNATFTVIE